MRSCRAAGIRKLIIGPGTPTSDERCSSPRFRECHAFLLANVAPGNGDQDRGDTCPLLEEQHVRYCSAASVPHYVPWSEQAGPCGSSAHRYCELWLSIARPVMPGQGVPGHAAHDPAVHGIAVPRDLWYSPNHLWLQSDGGACHIGIDGFLARTISKVDGISFVTTSGVHQPSVVLTVCGIDWQLVFPNRLMITNVNSYLRHAPERLVADPYGAGWLFEAWPLPAAKGDAGVLTGLINGEQAYPWIQSEADRVVDFVHHLDPATMNDGGLPADDFITHLSRDEVLRLLHAFFAAHAAWGGTT